MIVIAGLCQLHDGFQHGTAAWRQVGFAVRRIVADLPAVALRNGDGLRRPACAPHVMPRAVRSRAHGVPGELPVPGSADFASCSGHSPFDGGNGKSRAPKESQDFSIDETGEPAGLQTPLAALSGRHGILVKYQTIQTSAEAPMPSPAGIPQVPQAARMLCQIHATAAGITV